MLRHPRCHIVSFVSDAALSATFSGHWGTGGAGPRRNSTFSYQQSRSMHKGKRAASSPLQEQQLIWWARKQRVRATYCRCTARLLLCHSGSGGDCVGVAERGHSVDITVPGQRAARADGRAQPKIFMEISRVESEHKHLAWRSREADGLDYTALSSFALTEKSWLQIPKKMFTGQQAVY